MSNNLFASAPCREASDPRDRVLGCVDFRAALLDGTLPNVAVACLGHLRQYLEMLLSHPQPEVSEKPHGK